MRWLRRKRDPLVERNRCIAEAREHLRIGFLNLVQAQIVSDATGDEALGDELYDLSHTLMHQVMFKLVETERGLATSLPATTNR